MPTIQDLLGQTAQQPQAQPAPALTQPSGGNPLAQLAPAQQPQAPPQPAPTKAQTIAAVHQFGQIKAAMQPILDDPNLGKTNIRPRLMDSFSKLLASKTLTLPEIMKAVKALPEDPVEQKNFVDKIYQTNDRAQMMVLGHHALNGQPQPAPDPNAPEDPASQWSPDSHNDHMAALMQHYGK